MENTELKQETALAERVMGLRDTVDEKDVESEQDFQWATEAVRNLKGLQKEVEEFWEPLRSATYESYKAVMAKKKAMLKPLEEAEKELKKKMGDYSLKMEQQRRELERAMREQARQEAEVRRADAAEAEEAGDFVGAEYARVEAEALEEVAQGGSIAGQTPKVAGVRQTKTWEIVSIDEAQVPVIFNRTVLRPVDKKAVLKAIKESGGTAEIPGVVYREAVSISVRSV